MKRSKPGLATTNFLLLKLFKKRYILPISWENAETDVNINYKYAKANMPNQHGIQLNQIAAFDWNALWAAFYPRENGIDTDLAIRRCLLLLSKG